MALKLNSRQNKLHIVRAAMMTTLLLTILTVTWAQAPDRVITTKNDTLIGKVKILGYDVIDRIQVNTDKTKHQFTAVQVKAVQLDNQWYGPVRTDYGYRMMKLMISGFLSLYVGRAEHSLVYDVDYVVRRDGRTMQVPNLTFKKGMAEFLDDCEEVSEKIKNNKLSKKDLTQIINEFNDCKDHPPAPADVADVVNANDSRLVALQALKSNIEKSNLPARTDALELLSDMTDKVRKGKTIANYQIESLKGMLKDSGFQSDLDQLVTLLKKE